MNTAIAFTANVLILEDEALLRELMEELVQSMGLHVVALGSADEGLNYLEQHVDSVGLLITDVRMPGRLDGHQLAIIATDRWPLLPVLITSGYTHCTPSMLPSNVAFLPKPWSLDQLDKMVRERLSAA